MYLVVHLTISKIHCCPYSVAKWLRSLVSQPCAIFIYTININSRNYVGHLENTCIEIAKQFAQISRKNVLTYLIEYRLWLSSVCVYVCVCVCVCARARFRLGQLTLPIATSRFENRRHFPQQTTHLYCRRQNRLYVKSDRRVLI